MMRETSSIDKLDKSILVNYQDYNIQDFLDDPDFVKWVVEGAKEDSVYWQTVGEAYPDKLPIIDAAKAIIGSAGIDQSAEQIEEDQAKIWENLHAKIQQPEPVFTYTESRNWWSKWGRIAAAVILLMGGLYWFSMLKTTPAPQPLAEFIHVVDKQTPSGQKSVITLSDGTKVYLNSGTTFHFHENTKSSLREVTLDGEAFFDVARDEQRPFVIHTSHTDVTVLGTSFNVKAYEKSGAKVAVASGRVNVSALSSDQEVFLEKGEVALYDQNQLIKTIYEDADKFFGWKDGKLLFENESMAEVVVELERWYGVEIQVSKGVNLKKRVTASYKGAALTEVLQSLAYTVHFQYEINGKEIMIK